jgi:Neuraminidase (sialidase)
MLRVEGIPNIGRDKDNFRAMTLAYSTSEDEGKTWRKSNGYIFGWPQST